MTEAIESATADFRAREREINEQVAELREQLRRIALDAVLFPERKGEIDELDERIGRLLTTLTHAREAFERADADRRGQRVLDLNAGRHDAAEAVQAAVDELVDRLEAWQAIAEEQQLQLTALGHPAVSAARAAGVHVLSAITAAAHARRLGDTLAWLPNSIDSVRLEDADPTVVPVALDA